MAAGITLNRSRQVPAEDTPAFGGIAERFRRAGDLDRAIQLCRDGLKKFPDHLSARVTLGWSLLDQGKYDEASVELEQALKRAPDNLAAIRGLAELHERAEQTMNLPMDGPGQWPPDAETIDAMLAEPADDALSFDFALEAQAEVSEPGQSIPEARTEVTIPAAPPIRDPAPPRALEAADASPPIRRKIKAGKRASSRAGRADAASAAEPVFAVAAQSIEPELTESALVLTNSAGLPLASAVSPDPQRLAEAVATLVAPVQLETFASAVAALAGPEAAFVEPIATVQAPISQPVIEVAAEPPALPIDLDALQLDTADPAFAPQEADDTAGFELSADVSLEAAMQDLVLTESDGDDPAVVLDLDGPDDNLDQLVQQLAKAIDDDSVVAGPAADLTVLDEIVPEPAMVLRTAEAEVAEAGDALGDVDEPIAQAVETPSDDFVLIVDQDAASSDLDLANLAFELDVPAPVEASVTLDVAAVAPETESFAPALMTEVAEHAMEPLIALDSDVMALDAAAPELTFNLASFALEIDAPSVAGSNATVDVTSLATHGDSFAAEQGDSFAQEQDLTAGAVEPPAEPQAAPDSDVAVLDEAVPDPGTFDLASFAIELDTAAVAEPGLLLTNPTIEDFPDLAPEMLLVETESAIQMTGDVLADDLPLLSAVVSEPSGPMLELTNPANEDFPEPIDPDDPSDAALVDGFDEALPDVPILTYLASLPDEPEPVVVAERIPSARIPLGRFLRQVQARRRQLVSESA